MLGFSFIEQNLYIGYGNRQVRPVLSWRKVFLFKHHIPRWAIIQRIIILGRFSANDKLHKWGVVANMDCVPCNSGNESLEHLFFSCSFSLTTWKVFWEKNGIRRPPLPLNQEVDWFMHLRTGRLCIIKFFYNLICIIG